MTAPAHLRHSRRQLPRRPVGLSIVELMVGIAISLFILAGATLVLTSQLNDNRRLLLEAQMQQDLRVAADLISRDVRRAAFWGKAYCQVWPAQQDAAACPTTVNPYRNITLADAIQLKYARSTDSENSNDINRDDDEPDVDAGRPSERVGFKWNEDAGTIDFMVSEGNWQALTDGNVMRVTQFNMVLNSQVLPVPCAAVGCQAAGPLCGGPVTVASRDITFTIVAQARHDASVQRSLRENVRLRNSVPAEQCP